MERESTDAAAMASLVWDGTKLVRAIDELRTIFAEQYPPIVGKV